MFSASKSKYQRVCYLVRNAHTTIPKMKARFLITSEKETCGMAPAGVTPGDAVQGPVLRGRQRAGLGPKATSLPRRVGRMLRARKAREPLPSLPCCGASLCPPHCSGAPSFPEIELSKLQVGLVIPLPRIQMLSQHQSRKWQIGNIPRQETFMVILVCSTKLNGKQNTKLSNNIYQYI